MHRVENERRFHDLRAAEVDIDRVDVEAFFEAYTAVENRKALRFLGPEVRGKELLDLGCGYGEASVYFAKQGARVTGIDVSSKMLDLARRLAERHGVAPVFQQAAIEQLPFENQRFDLAYGCGILHHADLERALQEVRRVLRPGGRVALIEPLAYNPLVNIYRRMATRYRSLEERPLVRSDVAQALRIFSKGTHEECWLAGQLVFCVMYLWERLHPNDTPYWKWVIAKGDRYRRWLAPLLRLDEGLTKTPVLRWLSHTCVLELENPSYNYTV